MKASVLAPLSFLVCALGAGCASTSAPAPASAPAAPEAAPSAAPTASSPSDPCLELSAASWSSCEGKTVRVEGKKAAVVLQHPSVAPPSLDGSPSPVQAYLDVDGVGQVVVLGADPSTCSSSALVSGKLRAVRLGGEPGTKSSYQGWVIEGASLSCK